MSLAEHTQERDRRRLAILAFLILGAIGLVILLGVMFMAFINPDPS